MLCPSCNTNNRDNARFCKKCGHLLAIETVIPNQTQAAQNTYPASPPVPESTLEPTIAAWPTPEFALPPALKETQRPLDPNDISLAPTQILTPAQMIEYNARRWQKEQQQLQDSATTEPGLQIQPSQDAVDAYAPTVYMSPDVLTIYSSGTPDSQQTPEPVDYTLAEAPTIIAPVAEVLAQVGDETINPSSQVSPDQPADHTVAEPATPSAPEDDADAQTQIVSEQVPSFEEEQTMEQNSQSAEITQSPEAAASDNQPVSTSEQTFSLLDNGTIVHDRYEVLQTIKAEPDEHIYEVRDTKGYLYCWNCSSTDNVEGDEFCATCGAELGNATYLMHEYPVSSNSKNVHEANVIAANIIDTAVENGHVYAIERQQSEQNDFPNGVQLLTGSFSDAGNLRRSDPNEDSTLVLLFTACA